MKPTTPQELSCSVFGHNLESNKTSSHTDKKVRCKSCDQMIDVNDHGVFEISPIQNLEIRQTLQRLFLLEHRLGKSPYSI